MSFTAWLIPLIITGLFGWGLACGVDVFDCFLQGAKEGLRTAASITPALVCLLTAVTMLRASGGLAVLTGFLRPAAEALRFPAEALPLALLKPVSGSGSTALLHQLLEQKILHQQTKMLFLRMLEQLRLLLLRFLKKSLV